MFEIIASLLISTLVPLFWLWIFNTYAYNCVDATWEQKIQMAASVLYTPSAE
jgi:hypothetical protein